MLKIVENKEVGTSIPPLGYARDCGLAGRCILRFTKWLRTVNAERYMTPADRHLDIGCGDGDFLRRSKAQERFGLDMLLGDDISDGLDFTDSYFDYVTMLAVIEHVSEPEAIFKEAARVLKSGGRFIITTPRKSAESLIKIYAKNIEQEHVSYFDYNRIQKLAGTMFDIVGHHSFIFGLNQVFCLKKR